jgi:hypothetical protein
MKKGQGRYGTSGIVSGSRLAPDLETSGTTLLINTLVVKGILPPATIAQTHTKRGSIPRDPASELRRAHRMRTSQRRNSTMVQLNMLRVEWSMVT